MSEEYYKIKPLVFVKMYDGCFTSRAYGMDTQIYQITLIKNCEDSWTLERGYGLNYKFPLICSFEEAVELANKDWKDRLLEGFLEKLI